jgi:hypothetical protein
LFLIHFYQLNIYIRKLFFATDVVVSVNYYMFSQNFEIILESIFVKGVHKEKECVIIEIK